MNTKLKLKSLLILLLGLLSINTYAQDDEHKHEHPQNEFGIANSLVYFTKEKEVAYGLHVHLLRTLGHSKFGYGIAYERVFDEHKHNTIGLAATYRPIDALQIALSPGITFEGDHPSEIKFAFHAETSYEFEIGKFHVGPLLEIAFDPEDIHISMGLHIGLGF